MLGTGKVSVPETSERRDVGAPGDPPPLSFPLCPGTFGDVYYTHLQTEATELSVDLVLDGF